MYPRVSSYAAICGRSPVASVGQPIVPEDTRPAVPGSEDDYLARKQHQSDLLDEAIDESFPASDPASPFVAAAGAMAQPAPAPLKVQGDAIDSME